MIVNGGYNGLSQRKLVLDKIKKKWGNVNEVHNRPNSNILCNTLYSEASLTIIKLWI